MHRYIVFIRKLSTGEEFVSARMGVADSHALIMAEVSQKYPASDYQVLTAYTEAELNDIMESVRRWSGRGSNANARTSAKHPPVHTPSTNFIN